MYIHVCVCVRVNFVHYLDPGPKPKLLLIRLIPPTGILAGLPRCGDGRL